jgi:alpha-tubulin suppressor-like RCC1 family protein
MELRTVAAGQNRSFFVDANGALLACGRKEEGEVGLQGLREGTSQTSCTPAVPKPVPSMAGVRIRAVVCNEDCNLAVSEAGHVFSWGQALVESTASAEWHPRVPTVMEELRNCRVRQVVAGYFHCAALTEDGALFTWEVRRTADEPEEPLRDRPVPELGHGSFVRGFGVPRRVLAFEGVRIASVAVGDELTVAVTEAGAVYSCGFADGRLGHGEDDMGGSVFLPKRIEALDGIHVVTVAAGDMHAVALTQCGRLYSWGALGLSSPVLGLGDESDDSGDRDDNYFFIPQLITALVNKRVRVIAAGPTVSCAVTDAGALYTWGDNTHGNLGHGDVRPWDRPTLVTALHGIRVVGVSMYSQHTLALAADGSVYAFGKGPGPGIRQTGEGEEDGEATRTPQRIPNLVCMVHQR